MMNKKTLPLTYVLISIILMLALHFLFPIIKVVASLWRLLGLVPLACGIALNLMADQAFNRVNTTVKPFQKSTALITEGAFRVSRNPMYLGFVLILIGVALLMGSLTPYIVIPIFAILMDRIFIRVEERMLEETFGQAWLEYAGKVRRWI